MMDNLIKSFKALLYDRVTSPLLSSFLISWAVWNHRLFLTLMTSDLKLKERFAFADEILYPTWREVLGRGFAWPLLSALTLIFIYPNPGRWVYGYVRKEQKYLKQLQQQIDDDTPITQEEARELRAAIRKADADFQKEIAVRNETIARLKAELATQEHDSQQRFRVQTSLKNTDSDLRPNDPVLNGEQIKLLRKIAEATNGLESGIAATSSGDEPVVAHYNLDELVRHKFVEHLEQDGYNYPERYKATATGRAFLIKTESPSG